MANVNPARLSVASIGTTNFNNPPLNQLLKQITSIKLDRDNFLLWKNLTLPILRSNKLEGHLSGEKPCPPKYVRATTEGQNVGLTPGEGASSSEAVVSGASTSTATATINPQYESWIAIDQLLLGWLYNSMTPEVATQVMGFENSQEFWAAVQDLFGIQSQAKEDYLCLVFRQSRKEVLH